MTRFAPVAALRSRIALVLIGLALGLRILIPAGWMPAQGQGFALTLCTGTGATAVWVDRDGKLHEHPPASAPDHQCAFSGIAAPMLVGLDVPVAPPATERHPDAAPAFTLASIGQGLAAPPPPATGPPQTI